MKLDDYLNQAQIKGVDFAKTLAVPPSMISQWRTNARPVPADRCPEIEKATLGNVKCEELRPDVDWAYLRGTEKAVA